MIKMPLSLKLTQQQRDRVTKIICPIACPSGDCSCTDAICPAGKVLEIMTEEIEAKSKADQQAHEAWLEAKISEAKKSFCFDCEMRCHNCPLGIFLKHLKGEL